VVAGTQIGGRLVGRVGISRTLAAGMTVGAAGLAMYLRLPATASLADLVPGMIVAGLGQGVAFTTMYVAAGTGVARGEQGVASAMASTAQQIGGSVGLAALVALLTARALAIGGVPGGPTAQSPGVLTGALHATFAAQTGIALLGAAVALFVIGRGERGRRSRAEPPDRRAGSAPRRHVEEPGMTTAIPSAAVGAAQRAKAGAAQLEPLSLPPDGAGQPGTSGSRTSTEVPSPAGLTMVMVPPMASTRSRSPRSPLPLERSAPPTPSSLTESWTAPSEVSALSRATEARACLAALASASATT
jgi:hypothetical protein